MSSRSVSVRASLALAALSLAACGKGVAARPGGDGGIASAAGSSVPIAPAPARAKPPPPPPESPREALGRAIFFDPSLSSPPGTSCASCHDPARAFAGTHGSPLGVALGSRAGHFSRRTTPSLLYVKFVPAFHFALEDDDDVLESAFGGFGWGGRADSIAAFVRFPLLDPDEMNNRDLAEIAGKVRSAPYADVLAHEFPRALDTADGAVDALGKALEAFLTSPPMAPFTSKYDDFLRHTGTLSPLEMRGLKLFKEPTKGACDACHVLEDSSNRPERSLFTNYEYDSLAPPRNRSLPANADRHAFDLGLCERKASPPSAPSSAAMWCAKFRTPSLRNVAVRERFMHNGAFSKLRDVVAFYATRSTSPARWYPPGEKFDDVPAKYRDNVNVSSLPYNRREGVEPAYDDEEVDPIVAFLETLTDEAYRSPRP